jgi:hypothetical protein
MLRRTLVLMILALAIPTVALAAKPQASTSKSKAAPEGDLHPQGDTLELHSRLDHC